MLNGKQRLLGSTAFVVAAFACAGLASPASAQEVVQTQAQDQAEQIAQAQGEDTIVVTGSRVRRDTFTSAAPIQVYDTDSALQIGITDIGELLQRSVVANGQQIDATLNTNAGNSNATEAPPTGGVGSSNIDLRGLGPERTLILVNGRRLGSAGVRGAPAQPDIGMLPIGMVQSVEVLTEGAAAVYGADAVAGVVNVILKDDFEGLELSTNIERPEHEGGDINQISLTAGAVGDRTRFTFGAEFYDRERISTGDRDFSRALRSIEITQDGEIISVDRDGFFDNVVLGLPLDASPNEIFFFYTPGSTNIGVPDWSDYNGLPQVPGGVVDFGNDDNFPYFDFYNDQDERRRSDLVQPLRRFSAVFTGAYELDRGSNTEAYAETYYLNRTLTNEGATEQIFPDILVDIPIYQLDGNGGIAAVVGTTDNPLNPFDAVDFAGGSALGNVVTPILTIDDVPQIREVEVEQFRQVMGIRGDITAGWFGQNNWSWDAFFSYDRGIGFQSQPVMDEQRLIASTLGVYQDADTGEIRCGIPPGFGLGGFDTRNTCVPLNLFAPSVYASGEANDGRLPADAADYLIGNRTNRTVVQQYLGSAFVTGDLFELPWESGGIVGVAVGGEYRRDSISSQNSFNGVIGGNAAENPLQEGETEGSRDIYDVYGEAVVPLIQDQPMIEELTFEGAVRFTDEENFGSEVTYRARGLYRPVDWMQFSASYGTTFRAPNLREQFLADQGGGIGGGNDPCINANIQNMTPGDPSTQFVIDQCTAAGVVFGADGDGNGIPDTVLGTQGVTTIPISVGGNNQLEAETSDAYTVTWSVSQPWFSAFNFDFAVSYFNIAVENTVEELDASTIINRCYTDEDFPNLSSPFCNRITRPGGNPASNIINFVDASFINIGEETVEGVDFNTRFGYTFDGPGGSPVDFSWATATSYLMAQETEIFGPADRDDNVGEIGTPELQFTSNASLRWENFELIFQSRYIDDMQQDGTDAFAPNLFDPAGRMSRDVDFTDSIWYHDAAISYAMDEYSITFGVNNLLDEEPPLIDAGEGPNRNNAVSSTGYDFIGRTFFVSARANF
jgi:iron complex outermembrane receptor protein